MLVSSSFCLDYNVLVYALIPEAQHVSVSRAISIAYGVFFTVFPCACLKQTQRVERMRRVLNCKVAQRQVGKDEGVLHGTVEVVHDLLFAANQTLQVRLVLKVAQFYRMP